LLVKNKQNEMFQKKNNFHKKMKKKN